MALVSLLVVAWLAKETLSQMGFTPTKTVAAKPATLGERARAPGAIDVETEEGDATAPAPSNAIARARAVQGTVQQQADELAARIDKESR